MLGCKPVLLRSDQQGQILGHLAVFDGFDADPLKRLGKFHNLGRAIKLAAIHQAPGPSENAGDRVGAGRFAFLMLAIMACDGAVSRFCLDGFAIRRHQNRSHQAKRAEALSNRVGLNIAVIVLTSPDEFAVPFECGGYHVIDQAVLVSDACLGEFLFEFGFEHFFEEIFEAAIIGFHDGVFGGEVNWPLAVQTVIHRCAGKIADRIVEVVHRHRDARTFKFEHIEIDILAICAFKDEAQLARSRDQRVGGAVLVTKSMTANHDRVRPAGHKARHIINHNRLAENDAAQNVADRAIGRTPHFLKAEFLNPRLVRGNRGAFDAYTEFFDRIGRIDGDLIVRLITLLNRQIIILKIDVEIGQDQPFADPLPDDFCHFVAIKLDDGVLNLNFLHDCPVFFSHSGGDLQRFSRGVGRRKGPSAASGAICGYCCL